MNVDASVGEKRLAGKTCAITGAGSGIGRAIATRFATEGANVIVNDINEKAAITVADHLRQLGIDAIPIVADVSDETAVERLVQESFNHFTVVDVLVNNAGVGASMRRIISMPVDTWDRIIRVNLRSVFLCSKFFAKHMKKRNCPEDELRGKIINMASARGLSGRAMFAAYSASKAGVVSLTQSLAQELGRYRVTVNAIAPGLIHTPMYGNISIENLAGTNPEQPALKFKPVGVARDVAGVAFFLASSDSDWMTGQCLPVTGGREIH